MIVAGRELVFQQGFLDALHGLESWTNQSNTRSGRALVKRVADFVSDIVAPFPFSFPAFRLPTAPARTLRRAVLDRRYAVICEVHETELLLVLVYSTHQNADLLELPASG